MYETPASCGKEKTAVVSVVEAAGAVLNAGACGAVKSATQVHVAGVLWSPLVGSSAFSTEKTCCTVGAERAQRTATGRCRSRPPAAPSSEHQKAAAAPVG